MPYLDMEPRSSTRKVYSETITSPWYIFGSGTKLTVTDPSQPKTTPTVSLYPPSPEELRTEKATMVCLITNYYPDDVTVTWKEDGKTITQGVQTTESTKQSNRKYALSSYLTLTSARWKTHSKYTCQATHDGTTTEQTVVPAECAGP
ncbi:PREDICTED: immunoglobulin lambda-like polypeptide 5-like [Elephantulus edwardii]|uniref:immunoglobulin lambda-like polypeptide 5-like n=1 Tax=Elephantulus edwardii TaxID=28737 RepID=UPI0003F0D7AA|nr:PREDICTED: immunoglobulin lambda-like polypeptide 5-like [Elephantulus edwardii]